MPFCTPEEVFELFANQTVFNIHLKQAGVLGFLVHELLKLAQAHQACASIYFADSPSELEWIRRTVIQLPHDEMDIWEMVKAFDCSSLFAENDSKREKIFKIPKNLLPNQAQMCII